MIRKQIYIEPRQEALLKRLAQEMNVTEAELIRQAIDQRLASGRARFRDPRAWDEARTFIQEWVALGPVSGGRNWTREELYEERE
jgi:hypothetical protein